ncbi:hypothetical protein [Variovorax sp. GT1P44]|uniref:hypothetical protein n=1 Tax=Variovorax sp. GT1P44 TaxID=3443742 RepID=UPI003F487E11
MLARICSVGVVFASCAIVSGCNSYPPPATIGGYKPPAIFGGFMSPQVSRTSCIDSVAREFKVPKSEVTPTSDAQTMEDGFYVVTLSIGAGQPAINCTVNENGVVSDVIRAR